MRIQAVLLAGDRAYSRSVRGRSKGFVDLDGKPMVIHVLEALLRTPEVSEVFVVGDAIRLEKALSEHGALRLAAERSRAVHIVPQRETLYENIWHTFLRTLPASGGRDDHAILVAPNDIPLVIPEEISDFLQKAAAAEADYAVGISPDVALAPFAPRDGNPGIEMASFNLSEGRFRQNNLHYVRPLRMGNRHYIEDMYENRFQKEFGSMVRLGWKILRREYRHLWVLFFYLAVHVAGVLDRRGYRRLADRVRAPLRVRTLERAVSAVLKTRFRTVITHLGGAAIDVDTEEHLGAAEKMIGPWKAAQLAIAQSARPARSAAAPPAA